MFKRSMYDRVAMAPEKGDGDGEIDPGLAEELASDGAEFSEEEMSSLRGLTMGDDGDLTGADPDGDPEDAAAENVLNTLRKKTQGEQAEKKTKTAEEEAAAGDQRQVPLQALHAARNEIRTMREEVAALTEFRQSVMQKVEANRKAQFDQRPLAHLEEHLGPRPDPEEDPVGATVWNSKAMELEARMRAQQDEQTQQQQQEAQRRQQEEQQQNAQLGQVIEQADNVLISAIEADTSVKEAFDFAVNAITYRFQSQGLSGDQLEMAVKRATFMYAKDAPKDQKGMIEYAKANARYWGWVDPALNGGRRTQQGGQDAAARLAALRRTSVAGKTLSGGGQTGDGFPEVDELNGLSGADLEALMANDKYAGRLQPI